MKKIIESSWAKRIEYDNGDSIIKYSLKKRTLDLFLITAGAAAMYGIGRLVGEGIDHVPYLKELIPQAVNYVSGIDIKGNIDGLAGILGGIYGLSKSGITLDKKTLKATKAYAAPITLTLTSTADIK